MAVNTKVRSGAKGASQAKPAEKAGKKAAGTVKVVKKAGGKPALDKLGYAIVFVTDMKRGVEFYKDVLGVPLKFDSPEWTEFDMHGVTLALHATEKMPKNLDQAPIVELCFDTADVRTTRDQLDGGRRQGERAQDGLRDGTERRRGGELPRPRRQPPEHLRDDPEGAVVRPHRSLIQAILIALRPGQRPSHDDGRCLPARDSRDPAPIRWTGCGSAGSA